MQGRESHKTGKALGVNKGTRKVIFIIETHNSSHTQFYPNGWSNHVYSYKSSDEPYCVSGAGTTGATNYKLSKRAASSSLRVICTMSMKRNGSTFPSISPRVSTRETAKKFHEIRYWSFSLNLSKYFIFCPLSLFWKKEWKLPYAITMLYVYPPN
jgi:hypothetical protein